MQVIPKKQIDPWSSVISQNTLKGEGQNREESVCLADKAGVGSCQETAAQWTVVPAAEL